MAENASSVEVPATLNIVQVRHRDRDYRYPASKPNIGSAGSGKEFEIMDHPVTRVLVVILLILLILALLGRCEFRIDGFHGGVYHGRADGLSIQSDERYWKGLNSSGDCEAGFHPTGVDHVCR